jgi:LPXTG-site transpeptidase (sortase) family protein
MLDQPGGSGGQDVTSTANYTLTRDGAPVQVNGVYYENSGGAGPFTATVLVNNGAPLPSGNYTFTVNGTTSVVNLFGIRLSGDGVNNATDFTRNFTVNAPVANIGPGGGSQAAASIASIAGTLPETGFTPQMAALSSGAPGLSTPPRAPIAADDLTLEIPRLGVSAPVVSVPLSNGEWDTSWLGGRAGWLEGTAFPTLPGSSVLTGHVYDSNGQPGPFVNLRTLWWGDRIVVRAWGQTYVYAVRSVQQVNPDDLNALQHEELDWLTLVTCRGFDESSGEYRWRVVVRAVLVSVE